MASKVYFADFRCPSWRENLQQKLARLMKTAGMGDIDLDGKYRGHQNAFRRAGQPGLSCGPTGPRRWRIS